PVTEQVTGEDLVHLQLRLALDPQSFQLPVVQEPRGHSIEVRLYAEDPAQGFAPTPGKVEFLRWPTGTGIRVESGIEQGQTIGTQFDSMLGKIIIHAPTREMAIQRMRFALEETVIAGLGTNQRYLLAIARDPQVLAGKVHTGYLEKAFTEFRPEISPEQVALASELTLQRSLGRSESVRSETATRSPWSRS
ncbi:MAG: hypothetical protein KGQ59_07280, partial [Bdellovibrionales bacterium]|nr:hypothetical protein [Bdellovibrionales bacterium]